MTKTFTQEEVHNLLSAISFMGGSCHWSLEFEDFVNNNSDWLDSKTVEDIKKISDYHFMEHTLNVEINTLKDKLEKLEGIIQAVEEYKK